MRQPMANKMPQKQNSKAPSAVADEISREANNNSNSSTRELLVLLQKYTSGSEFRQLVEIDRENEGLKTTVANLRITNDTNFEDFLQHRDKWQVEKESYEKRLSEEEARHTREVRQREAAVEALAIERATVDDLRGQVTDQDDRVLRLVEKAKRNEEEITKLENAKKERGISLGKEVKERKRLEDDLKGTKKQLDVSLENVKAANETLAIFRTFIVNLTPLHKKRDQIRQALADMFDGALDYFQSSLGLDVDDGLLVQVNNKGYLLGPTSLPLPPSNTSAAKQMRVVAGLMMLAKALVTHIFKSTYMTKSHEFDKVLSLIAQQHPLQESFVRAALLRALPDTQKKVQEESVDKVVQEVSKAVGPWLQNEQAFVAGLRQVCDRASITWALLQRVEERIWPDVNFQLPEDWLPLPISRHAPIRPSSQNNQRSVLPSGGNDSSTLVSSDVVGVVWPAFFAHDLQEPESVDTPPLDLLFHGYVLTRTQIKPAEDETSESSQRLARRSMRRAAEVAPRKRKDSGVFLTNGSSSTLDSK